MKKIWTTRLVAVAAIALMSISLFAETAEARDKGFGFGRFFGSQGQGNLVEKLEQMGDFSVLLTALDTAGLTDTVATAEALTVFAPTDAAFVDLLNELEISAGDLLASPDLTNILLYHVLPGMQRSGSLISGSTAATLYEDQPVLVIREGRMVKVNQSYVDRPNVRTSNGYIHVIGAVLLPPQETISVDSIIDVLRLDGRFSVLLTALDTAGLTDTVATAEALTLFAPTDDAFVALLNELGISAGDLLANPALSDILLYHVAGGNQRALNLLINRETPTLQGQMVNFSFKNGGVYINDAKLLSFNVNAPNGLIHIIEGVLIPE